MMNLRRNYELPEDQQNALRKAIVLEWVTIFFLLTITVLMYLTLGSSQAMKTAWIEDVLSLVPPISFLVSMRYRDRQPNERFPYGYRRATLLAFLVAAASILMVGLYLLYHASLALIQQEHPTLGHFAIFGTNWHVWSGWVMIAALTYSVLPPIVLGRMKLPLAKRLHEKTLYADADMNKADWMTGAAAILGIIGLGFGFWWADAVAAAVISVDVIKDGVVSLKGAMYALMDQRPTDVEDGKPLGLTERLRDAVIGLPDVADASVRLREEGHVISGEIFLVMTEQEDLARRIETIAQQTAEMDWRLHELVVMPVKELEADSFKSHR